LGKKYCFRFFEFLCWSISMSNDSKVAVTIESFHNSEVKLGNLPVARALPVRGRRLVGPWCFLDRFGPLSFAEGKPMDVAPHPHIGLQTVTWLIEGEVMHDDSLGCQGIVRPGHLNVMTSGRGIAHAEQTPASHSGQLNGVQLWAALPDPHRNMSPAFESLTEIPAIEQPGGIVQVFSGSLAGITSRATHYSDLLGADIQLHQGARVELDLQPTYEHAVLILSGDCALENQPLAAGALHYLGTGRSSICLQSQPGARVLLIGGPPFPEKILMWWNFVARTPEEIAAARADWEDRRRFGEVNAYQGSRLVAPNLLPFAKPNPAS
jgi:redox-sensitive bicupin YhaK (pirin superfamily)